MMSSAAVLLEMPLSKWRAFKIAWKRGNQRITRKLPIFIEQSLFFGSFTLVCYGIWLIYHPAGFIAAGIALKYIQNLLSAELSSRR